MGEETADLRDRLHKLESLVALSNQSLVGTCKQLEGALGGLQASAAATLGRIEEFSRMQGGFEAHSASLERMFQLVSSNEKIHREQQDKHEAAYRTDMLRLQTEIKEIQQEAALNWTNHLRDTDAYRTTHEADNNGVKQNMSKWNGIAIGISAVAFLITGLLAYMSNTFKQSVDANTTSQNELNLHVQQQLGNLDSRLSINTQHFNDIQPTIDSIRRLEPGSSK